MKKVKCKDLEETDSEDDNIPELEDAVVNIRKKVKYKEILKIEDDWVEEK